MRFRSLPFTSFLSASAVLAVPHVEDMLTRSSPSGILEPWVAGVAISEDCQTFRTVSSSFTIPVLGGEPGSVVDIANGISGEASGSGAWVGITCTVGNDPPCTAFTEAVPVSTNIHPFSVSFGDKIDLFIRMESATSAVALILNERTGQYVNDTLTFNQPLCMRDVAWIIGLPENGVGETLAAFEEVMFTDAVGTDWSGWARYTPTEGDHISNVIQGGQSMTTVWVQEDSVIIRYV